MRRPPACRNVAECVPPCGEVASLLLSAGALAAQFCPPCFLAVWVPAVGPQAAGLTLAQRAQHATPWSIAAMIVGGCRGAVARARTKSNAIAAEMAWCAAMLQRFTLVTVLQRRQAPLTRRRAARQALPRGSWPTTSMAPLLSALVYTRLMSARQPGRQAASNDLI